MNFGQTMSAPMIANNTALRVSVAHVVMLAMDDVGRCLLDVIDDPQLLQSFLENTNGAIGRENLHNSLHNNPNHKSIASVKPIDPKLAANISIATQFSDTKQVDHVTSSGGNRSPLQSINKPTSGQLVIDEKQTINMVSSSVGLIPVSALSNAVTATSLSIAQPTLTAYTTTASVGQMSTTMRTSAQGWPPTQFQLANPRGGGALTVQMPQQFLLPPGAMQMTGPGGIQQLVLTRPGVPHGGIPPGIQPGQLVQIIQTPSGPQILPTNPTATVQSIVSTSVTTKSSSTTSSSRSNKQILPKPPGSSVSATNAVTTNSNNKCQQMTQQNTLKVINSLPNAPQFASAQIPTSGAAGHQTQQILIGPGGHPVISGPQGTFLLNHMIPGIGGQPILINGNLGNGIPNSFQLTLRPNTSHGSSMMTMSNGLTAPLMSASENNTNILNALNANVAKQTPTQSPQPQTFVIPNHSTAVSSAAPGMVVTNAGRPAPNIIFTRPQMMGAPQSQPQGQQFLQLQTPNGPILVALQTQPQLIPQQQASASQPTHGIQLGNHMIPIGAQHMSSQLAPNLNASIQTAAAHPALHALLTHTDNTSGQTVIQTSVPSVVTSNTHVILTSQPQIITRPQLQQSQSQQLKHSSAPSLNLAELLKEHGILPESSPPSSPTNNSLTDITTGAIHSELIHPTQQSHQTVLMVPSGPNQPPNIVLTQNPVQATAPPQLRLALGPDGSVILQPHITTNTNGLVPQIQSQFISNSNNLKFNESLKDSSGLGSSQPSPDSTTPSIDSTSTSSTNATLSQTTTTSTTTTPSAIGQNTSTTSTSALLDQLNTGPAVKVPDIVASLALTHHSSTGPAVTEESKPIQSQTALIPLTVQNINNSLEQQKQTILTIPVQSGDNNVVQNGSNGSSNAVIRIGSCDTIPTSLVLTTTPTTVFASPPPKTLTTGPIAPIPTVLSSSTGTVSVTGTTTTVIDHNGVPMIQVSPNNQEFLQRLDTQLKNLLLLKSPTNQQKELLQELLSLQQKLNVARSKNTSDDQKLILTTASTINISPQTQQALQSSPNNQMSIDSQSQQQTPQNVHLMNLLKQTPVNQSSASQIRLLTPASAAPVNGTATIQVGNQLITFTTPVKQQLQNLKSIQTSNQTISKPQLSAPTPTVILRYHTPTPTTSSTLVTTSTTTKPSIIKNDTQDKERRNAKILKSIQQQLNVDQNAALKPDTKKPFNSRDDACKRLLRYHVFNAPVMSTSDMDKSDRLFEMVSQHLLHKKQQLFDKFRVLLLKQSMKETPSSEHVMIDRMFINEEMSSLKADRETVAEGKCIIK
ncbi:unnamed protein product [Medioppia subpectinata]|uniref:GLTSCR protein conserved domain-containing protein n=1 Tax=Medioppia subpectinata TaxID=1979941 RepID=A0A7R9KL19_9ACAR|nr:unnamed protein product [Medioppia subpectinata]CAG2105226.1 unnamed protein product [Medioppia subpectinata]